MASCEINNAPSSLEGRHLPDFLPQSLQSLDEKHLNKLIPQRLLELAADPSKVTATRIRWWSGRSDNGFEPSLGLLIFERNALKQPIPYQEPLSSHWEHVLNYQRRVATKQKLLKAMDRVLLALIADDKWNQNGVEVLSLIITESLRGSGVGAEFQQKFVELLRKMGYRYSYGVNNQENVGFFLKTGRYLLGQLKPDKLTDKLLLTPSSANSDYTTIRFLDEVMEAEYVQPQFLRGNGRTNVNFSGYKG